jgi:hypothetical protein
MRITREGLYEEMKRLGIERTSRTTATSHRIPRSRRAEPEMVRPDEAGILHPVRIC